MTFWLEVLDSIRGFFDAGGWVLWPILGATVLMWTLIVERVWFFSFVLPKRIKQVRRDWDSRRDTTSWFAQRVRQMLISQVSVQAHQFIRPIRTLMAILPLLGLLGTVSGMIVVFDNMAISGTGNARAMAGGVSAATIPTMAGLVAALSGLYFTAQLESKADTEVERVADLLRHH